MLLTKNSIILFFVRFVKYMPCFLLTCTKAVIAFGHFLTAEQQKRLFF